MKTILLAGLCVTAGLLSGREQDPERKGTVVGLATAKGGYWIEVKADGEEKARKYYCGSDPVALKAVKATEIGSRVRLDWRFEEVFRVVKIEELKPPEKEKE
jgi:hypothetical protein